MNDYLIHAENLVKTYPSGTHKLKILEGIDFSVHRGDFISIMGPSGSGKSTLLHILGCMDRPTSGKYAFSGIDITTASDRHLAHFRAHRIGFVFQTFNLIHSLNVIENVELPFTYAPRGIQRGRQNAVDAIAEVGLSHRQYHRPAALSGGEMQRVAIARAIAVNPELLLADEPTGNLDAHTGEGILKLLTALNASGKTIIMVTHDRQVASYARRIMTLKDGILV